MINKFKILFVVPTIQENVYFSVQKRKVEVKAIQALKQSPTSTS